MALAFGAAWAITGIWPFVFPMVFAGILPALEGFRRLAGERGGNVRIDQPVSETAQGQKQVLQAAKEENGIVTPALVALKTDLSISQAERILEEMAQMGYAIMHVNDNGRIEFEFPEFKPRLEE